MLEDRMLTLREMVNRSGMSKSYFYCGKSAGTLRLNVQRVGGQLRCKEADFERWLKFRPLLDATRPDLLCRDLLALVDEVKGDPEIHPDKYPRLFQRFAERLQEAFSAVAEMIQLDTSIPLGEYSEKFRAVAQQIEDGFLWTLPTRARDAFASPFFDKKMEVCTFLSDFVCEELRKDIRESIGTILAGIKRYKKTKEEKLAALAIYTDEETWKESGYGPEERARMIEEVLEAEEVDREDS
jgi:predicted DNA-binding transcriptional regulator AlpA